MPNGSVLVMDNGNKSFFYKIVIIVLHNFLNQTTILLASYHNARSGDVPKAAARKEELLNWLQSKGVDVGEKPTVKSLKELRAQFLKQHPC